MSDGEPRASVVIPTRDRGPMVERAVSSALAARGVGEVIVVDDGSTDDTPARLERFAGRIRVVAGTFGTAGAARNAGAARAAFPLLAFLDSDDEMLPGKVPCLAPRFADPAVGLVHGGLEVIDAGGRVNPARTREHERLLHRGEEAGTSYQALAGFCALYTSATLIRRSAFESVGGYAEDLEAYEDWDLYLRLSLRWRIAYGRCPVARYRVWPGNVPWTRSARGVIAVARRHLASLDRLEEPVRREARYALWRRVATARHALVQPAGARRAALAALRARPWAGLADRGVRGTLLRSFLPESALRRRRPALTVP